MDSNNKTNWCNLPNEMRMECIKRMDFKSRMRLRATSKHEKLLVEAAPKYYFELVLVNLIPRHYSGVNCGEMFVNEAEIVQKKGEPTKEFIEKAHKLIVQVLKFSTGRKLVFSANFKKSNTVSKFLIDNSNAVPFRFESIHLNTNKFEIYEFFLKNNKFVKEIYVENDDEAKLKQLIEFPAVINADRVWISKLKTAEIPYQLINNWLKIDNLKVGKRLNIVSSDIETVNVITKKFADRKISDDKNDGIVFSTADPTKFINIAYSRFIGGLKINVYVT